MYDQNSGSGMCIKPTDKCSSHCIHLKPMQSCMMSELKHMCNKVCTMGCNRLVKIDSPLPSGIQLTDGAKKVPTFDVVICQGVKKVQCAARKIMPVGPEGKALSTNLCSSKKEVQPLAVCPELDEFKVSVIYGAGASCALDAVRRMICERDEDTNKCLTTPGGSYVGCQQLDNLPMACPTDIYPHLAHSLHCFCHKFPQQVARPERCQDVAESAKPADPSEDPSKDQAGLNGASGGIAPWKPHGSGVHNNACEEFTLTL